MLTNNFINRHNGPNTHDREKMLKTIGLDDIDILIDQTIPASIRLNEALDLPDGMNEYEFVSHLKKIGAKNKLFKSFIGMG